MLSVFKGFVLPRFYWVCAWQGRRGKYCLKPLRRLLKIGKVNLYLTAYFSIIERYKPKALGFLKRFINIKDFWYDKNYFMKSCYSKQDGSYIGLPEDILIYLNNGITEFYKAKSNNKVASIGFASEKQKWYGWSHRAICGFAIGHVVKEGDCVRSSGWIEDCPEYIEDEKTKPEIGFIAKTLADCKYLAQRFAGSVG